MDNKILEDIYIYGGAINKATEYSGITEEQTEKFMTKFNEVMKELKQKQKDGTLNIGR
jgi:hypothetical protein